VPGAEVTGILSNTLGVVPLGRPPSPAQPAMIERYGDDATNDLRSEAPGRELSLRDAGLRSRSRPRDGRGSNRPLAAVDDVGRAINRLILHGQTHGGIAQGVGQALLEESTTSLRVGSCSLCELQGLWDAAGRHAAGR
jgi:hypothetical protein